MINGFGHVLGLLVNLDQQINLVSPQFEFIETVYINFWYCINFNVSLLEKKNVSLVAIKSY